MDILVYIGLILVAPIAIGELLGMPGANRLAYYGSLVWGFCRGVFGGLVATVLLFGFFQNECSGTNDCNSSGFVVVLMAIPLFICVGLSGYLLSWCLNIPRWMRTVKRGSERPTDDRHNQRCN
jgi:hypothetical protein